MYRALCSEEEMVQKRAYHYFFFLNFLSLLRGVIHECECWIRHLHVVWSIVFHTNTTMTDSELDIESMSNHDFYVEQKDVQKFK